MKTLDLTFDEVNAIGMRLGSMPEARDLMDRDHTARPMFHQGDEHRPGSSETSRYDVPDALAPFVDEIMATPNWQSYTPPRFAPAERLLGVLDKTELEKANVLDLVRIASRTGMIPENNAKLARIAEMAGMDVTAWFDRLNQ